MIQYGFYRSKTESVATQTSQTSHESMTDIKLICKALVARVIPGGQRKPVTSQCCEHPYLLQTVNVSCIDLIVNSVAIGDLIIYTYIFFFGTE